jgi:hypothetical protein
MTTTTKMMKRIEEASPRLKGRIAGALNIFSLLSAGFAETFFRGTLNFVGGYIAILSMVVVTLLLYDIFKAVNRGLALIAASFAFVGLTFEALRWQPQGVNMAIVVHGLYCLLIGYLILRSAFLPRILGALMVFAGFGWVGYMSPPLVSYLSPYNLTSAILAELSLILWLLVMGVNVHRWKEQAGATAEHA